MKDRWIIGSRGSALALWQANFIRNQLLPHSSKPIEILTVRTEGDRAATGTAPISEVGIFVKEIQEALRRNEIDLAVHSAKDLPVDTPPALTLAAVYRRDDPRDCLISRTGSPLAELGPSALIGTGSPRRQAQLLHHRRDLRFSDLRGNIDTRLRKLQETNLDAIILAKAGLDRLGWSDRISQVLPTEILLPAAAQGALAIETRGNDPEAQALAGHLDHPETRACVTAEQSLLRTLQGGCRVPIGALGRVEKETLLLEACVSSLDGTLHHRDSLRGSPKEAAGLGVRLAERLLSLGAGRILEAFRAQHP